MPADLGWTALRWPGLEHVIASTDRAGFRADSQLILAERELATVSYRLECDAGWRFRRLAITVTSGSGRRALALSAGPDGLWLADGQPRPDLGGCIDIDINCTPLTNTLPVRRLAWSPGTAQDLDVAYVSVPELEVRPVRQRYTMLALDERTGRALYRYESGSFTAELPLDRDGYVVDYPGLWRRIGPGFAGSP
jgi:uncharacterized protein